ncbi:transposable element Tc1 transposase [Trichonephila clavipes]|nr:transposable element Tc1 transposase [Trichonephila clavipes]
MLSKEFWKNCTKPMPHILQEFQQASGVDVLINDIHKKAHLLGFHGRAATLKPLITKSNHTAQLRWCEALQN